MTTIGLYYNDLRIEYLVWIEYVERVQGGFNLSHQVNPRSMFELEKILVAEADTVLT